ncbi:NifB/NifX family molybdenum-iron cluster-binding protein [Hydrogenimonas urashimensis]|uniref:NifB/NifX family molybdenum-iron cluster-binding protein n=1 Tax=Hydrogenimonas urashimensis TaxID=2740515 RepID=UPI001914ED60|nr:NifB/NifX family molybdenum-iron cluster-binding protein [Hydrogenimonas urashimensis]
MLIAMPVKMNRENPPLTTVFGKAKWFAFADEGGTVEIRENPYAGGPKTVVWLIDNGVDTIITQHIGGNPFMILKNAGVRLHYPGEGRIVVSEAIEKLKNGQCEEIDTDNVMRFMHH